MFKKRLKSITCLHHLQQLWIGESILAPDDGHGLGASVAVTVSSRGRHPGGNSRDHLQNTDKLMFINVQTCGHGG